MWYYIKDPIVEFSGVSRDALHVHLGLVIFLLVSIYFRNHPRRLLFGWLAVLAAQTINEALDFHDWYVWTRGWNWRKSLTDYVHTLLWPSILLLLASRRPRPQEGDNQRI